MEDRPARLELRLPPDPDDIAAARIFAAAAARLIGVDDEEEIDDIRLAISESVTNAVRAHLAAGVEEDVIVAALVGPESVTFEVVDSGAGFEPSSLRPEPEADGRFGLAVIRSLFVDASLSRNENGGMTLRFSVKAGADEPARSS